MVISRIPSCRLTHIVLISLILSLFILSSSVADHSPALLASNFVSRLFFPASHVSPCPSECSSRTCLGGDLQSNHTLLAVTKIKGTQGNSGKNDTYMAKDPSSCDIFNGKWVRDDSAPIYKPGSCPYIDLGFNCHKNGRTDLGYLRYKWKPHGCKIPRFDRRKMLEMLSGKRLVFVGDSLNRNMWESLVCALRESLKNKSEVFEVSGKREFRTQGFYSFIFRDYNCSIDFIRSPFLVQEWRVSDRFGSKRETLRLDLIHDSSSKYYNADVIIFNTGHWWTHQKTLEGKDYFQEGDHVHNKLAVTDAYNKALRTWAHWVDANINSNQTRIFFIGYSSSHFRKGRWNSGRYCYGEKQLITNDTHLPPYPWMMSVLESVITEMKTPVVYLNITKMTGYRKDGHPSIYRQPEIQRDSWMIQDCSHWCLPGVPDSWNELLYATLLSS